MFNFLLFLFSFWHPCDSDVGMFKVVSEIPKTLLIFLNSSFFILLWFNVYFFILLQTVDLSLSFLPFTLVPGTFSFVSLFIAFTFSSILQPYSTIPVSILVTSVWNSALDGLPLSSLLSYIFSGALICSFIWAIFFCLSVDCYVVRGRALDIRQGRTTWAPTYLSLLCGAVGGWGGVREGTMPLAWLLVSFQSLPPLPTSKLGPSGADSQVGVFVYILGPVGLSNELSCETGSLFCLVKPHRFFQRFQAFLFQRWNPWLHGLSHPPAVPPSLSACKCVAASCCLPHPVLQPLPCHGSSPSQLPASTLPTRLGECFFFNSLVIRLPYISIFWQLWLISVFKFVVVLLLVARRQSVSTYTCIFKSFLIWCWT